MVTGLVLAVSATGVSACANDSGRPSASASDFHRRRTLTELERDVTTRVRGFLGTDYLKSTHTTCTAVSDTEARCRLRVESYAGTRQAVTIVARSTGRTGKAVWHGFRQQRVTVRGAHRTPARFRSSPLSAPGAPSLGG